MDWQRRA